MWFSMEGALLAVARRQTRDVQALNGMQIGSRVGISKEETESRARELLESDDAARAGAAALAALSVFEASIE
jgi:hypothetical protein